MISKYLQYTIMAAFREAKQRRHEFLTLEHLLYALVHDEEIESVLNECGADVELVKNSLLEYFDKYLEKLPAGTEQEPQETLAFQRVLQNALFHVRNAEKEEAEAGDILAAILEEENAHAARTILGQGVQRVDVLRILSHGGSIAVEDDEESWMLEDPNSVEPNPFADDYDPETGEGGEPGPGRFLSEYCIDMVASACAGAIDPLIGRKDEIRRMLQVLCRRRKNNPLFLGDPGVGKTAIVEGLALMLAQDRVPAILKGYAMYTLDIGAALAGAKFRGQFEERIKGVLKAVRKQGRAILFIDEIHTIVGAGATTGGSMDASNLLKPFLAAGEVRCIGASTHEEYKQYFEKDRALSRRFQPIFLEEPGIDETYRILKGLRKGYEEHHGIRFTDAALKSAAELSSRFIRDRFLPDKAIDVIDEAAASLHLLPGGKKRTRITVADIENVVSLIARVPIRTKTENSGERLAELETGLKGQVYGQDEALLTLTRALKRAHAGLSDPDKPLGCFLFTGPTGVGKTEAAKQLAHLLGISFLRYDMSEYMEKHTVSRLVGAPPGYVGHEKGGLLTDSVRQHPHAVLLLDEIEKAHQDIFSVLLQVMDHATLTDTSGRKTDFRNVILIMTSNAGAREMAGNTIGFGDPRGDTEHKGKAALEKLFSPEFRNRLDEVICFRQLDRTVMLRVVDKFITRVEQQLGSRKILLALADAAREWLAEKGFDPAFGARPLARLIQRELKDPLSEEILFGALKNGGVVDVTVRADGTGLAFAARESGRDAAF